MVSKLPGSSPLASGGEAVSLFLKEVRARAGENDFNAWFRDLPCSFEPPGSIVIITPNKFQRSWMEREFHGLVQSCADELFDRPVHVEFSLRERVGERTQTRIPPSAGRNSRTPLHSNSRRPSSASSPETTANKEFTFEGYVLGPCNRVAHAGALAVCEFPGKTYNPLFVHGAPGLGKTHLLHAIHRRIEQTSKLRVKRVAAADFLHEFTAAAQDSDLDSFQRAFRSYDVLLLDDVHFLGGKEKTQLELLRLYNEFLEEGKQIVISSLLAPRDLQDIQGRLKSRFQSGLAARIEAPGFETRLEILQRKARAHGCELPLDVAEFLASGNRENVRELEGALLRVLSVAAFQNIPVRMEIARFALHEYAQQRPSTRSVTIAGILKAVQEYYHVKPRDLLSRSKVRSIVLPRQVAIYLARQLTPHSLQEIGMHLGGRDHTTILYSEERIAKLKESDAKLQQDIEALRGRLLASHSS